MSEQMCNRQGCTKHAKWAPKLNVPATGWPLHAHKPMAVLGTLMLCDEHMAEITPADMLGGECEGKEGMVGLKQMFIAATAGKVPPDFARAFMTRVDIEGDEFKQFIAQVEKIKRQQGDATVKH
jgi:hypothetical protein